MKRGARGAHPPPRRIDGARIIFADDTVIERAEPS